MRSTAFYTELSTKQEAPVLQSDTKASDELAAQIKAFQAAGGKIQKIEAGVSGAKKRVSELNGRQKSQVRPLIATCVKTGKKKYFESFTHANIAGFDKGILGKILGGHRSGDQSYKGFAWSYDNRK